MLAYNCCLYTSLPAYNACPQTVHSNQVCFRTCISLSLILHHFYFQGCFAVNTSDKSCLCCFVLNSQRNAVPNHPVSAFQVSTECSCTPRYQYGGHGETMRTFILCYTKNAGAHAHVIYIFKNRHIQVFDILNTLLITKYAETFCINIYKSDLSYLSLLSSAFFQPLCGYINE